MAVEQLRKELESNLQWGPAATWHSSMFSELSDLILEKCGVMLSPATLKRFMGVVRYTGSQSIQTLDTLCQFLDYENWRSFKLSNKKQIRRPRMSSKATYVTLGFVIALVTIALLGTQFTQDPREVPVAFSSRLTDAGYPTSVVFDLNVEGFRSDSIWIQQYWDPTKTIRVSQKQKQATGIYYFPGYFRAKLLVDGTSVMEHDLFLKSNGWLGTIEYEPVPKYFIPRSSERKQLFFPNSLRTRIETSDDPLISTFHFIDDLGKISGDNFTFQTTIQAEYDDKWAVCQSTQLYFIGTTGAMIIPLARKGCSSDNNVMLNDNYLSGKEVDLSSLSADLSQPVELMIHVDQKVVRVSIENETVFTDKYTQSMGRLVGVRYKFLGYGTVFAHHLQSGNVAIELP